MESLDRDTFIHTMSFLQGKDLLKLSQVSKNGPFKTENLQEALNFNLSTRYQASCKGLDIQFLIQKEVKEILMAANSSLDSSKDSYWVSCEWLKCCRDYFQMMSTILKKTQKSSSASKIKHQNIKLPRNPAKFPINCDLICDHGGLLPLKKCERRPISYESWITLKRKFLVSRELSCELSVECSLCQPSVVAKTAPVVHNRTVHPAIEMSPILQGIYYRKTGVPKKRELVENDDGIRFEYDAILDRIELVPTMPRFPLAPGMYILVPHNWLKSWRNYMRDPENNDILCFDSSCLLCDLHNRFLLPSHVEDYLVGLKSNILQSLSSYRHEPIMEIVSLEEWIELESFVDECSRGQFTVGLSFDGENVRWSEPQCQICDARRDRYVNEE